jgi:DNA-binding response OmpR family regulator
MQKASILLVEDTPEMQLLVTHALKGKYLVKCVSSSEEALSELKKTAYSLLIIDVELSSESGFVLLSKIRLIPECLETPAVFLSGRGHLNDKVMGFSLGAEDYWVKPMDPIELQMRVQAKLQRFESARASGTVVSSGPFKADLERMTLEIVEEGLAKHKIELTPIEFKLIVLLLRRQEHVLSREQILEEVWPQTDVTDRTVDSHIHSLRKKLGLFSACIQAVSGVGYRFRASQNGSV